MFSIREIGVPFIDQTPNTEGSRHYSRPKWASAKTRGMIGLAHVKKATACRHRMTIGQVHDCCVRPRGFAPLEQIRQCSSQPQSDASGAVDVESDEGNWSVGSGCGLCDRCGSAKGEGQSQLAA